MMSSKIRGGGGGSSDALPVHSEHTVCRTDVVKGRIVRESLEDKK